MKRHSPYLPTYPPIPPPSNMTGGEEAHFRAWAQADYQYRLENQTDENLPRPVFERPRSSLLRELRVPIALGVAVWGLAAFCWAMSR